MLGKILEQSVFFKKGQKISNLRHVHLNNLYSGPRCITEDIKKNSLEIVHLLDKEV